ncbi:winged helix-turn-helix domain-containing protein [Chitinispirillales bacterium ANBcel5]|uniref:helix-turn-helix transcriptional regulator n=1 Tax=Cellulosispirillum alkaliphilum TaxID=3039283 RepID=UPI002A4EA4DD|nr:winged helix-turn-helix domain-containing protein [Chitinispirillales bacterium ANBcel5]
MHEFKKNKNSWTFLTNHTHVLLCLARKNTVRVREIALEVGITERSVQLIISDLVDAGYIERKREGRCNSYRINGTLKLRHPLEQHKSINEVIELLKSSSEHTDITEPEVESN